MSMVMLLTMLPMAFAASDIENHWAKNYIQYLDKEGVINASATTGQYQPNRVMTRAEFMRYINRAFHFTETAAISYTDVQSNAWYYETVRIAQRYGYINGTGNNKMSPTGKVTRQQAAVIIGRLFKVTPEQVKPSDLSFKDNADIADWAAGYIKAAVDKGIIAGYGDGTFRPDKVVTRAEVAKILYYYLGTSLSVAGKAYTGTDLKADTANVTISENCTLSDAVIDGDLYLSEGLGSSAVTLNNVTVNGSIIISGGTVTMVNTVCDHMIVSSPMGRLLNLTATGATRIKQVEVRSAATLFEKGLVTVGYEGYEDVIVNGDKHVSLTLDAGITNLAMKSESTISTTAGTSIYHMVADKPASITGYGSVYQADIHVDGVSFANSVAVAGYTLEKGISATIAGKTVNTSSSVGVTPTKITVDLSDLKALGAGIDVSVPSSVTVDSVSCDGVVLSSEVAYTVTSSGVRIMTPYLAKLSRGTHTLMLGLSDGKRISVSVKVINSAAAVESYDLTFDRYYKSPAYRNLSVKLDGVNAQKDIADVVLGMTKVDYGTNAGAVQLRRSVLAQLRAGNYTLTVDLKNGGQRTINLTVEDSTPEGVNVVLVEYDTYEGNNVSFAMPLDRLHVTNLTATKNGSMQTLEQGKDYTVDEKALTLNKDTLEAFRRARECVEFSAAMSDNSVYTLVVDYM